MAWTIVSGGQTGVDRAALDAARGLGLPYGGHVPRGRRAEDGPLADDYAGMTETASRNPAVRTARNVRDSDATLILCRGAPDGGTALTLPGRVPLAGRIWSSILPTAMRRRARRIGWPRSPADG